MALQYVKFCTGLPETRTTGIAGAVLLTAVVPFFNLKVEYGSDVNQNEAEEQSLGCETTEWSNGGWYRYRYWLLGESHDHATGIVSSRPFDLGGGV